jgi:ankyrin repeat protein
LTLALDRQDEDILRPLLRHGVHSSFAMNLMDVAALHLAVIFGKPRAAHLLLEVGAGPDQRTWGDLTALHFAADARSLEMTRMLVEHGACSLILDQDGDTPHIVTAFNRQILIVQFLLVNDPDPILRGFFLKTINEYDSPEMEAVLLTMGPRGSRLAHLLQNPPVEEDLRAPSINVAKRKGRRKKSSRMWCWT